MSDLRIIFFRQITVIWTFHFFGPDHANPSQPRGTLTESMTTSRKESSFTKFECLQRPYVALCHVRLPDLRMFVFSSLMAACMPPFHVRLFCLQPRVTHVVSNYAQYAGK